MGGVTPHAPGFPLGLLFRVITATFLWGTAFPMNKTALTHFQPLGLGASRFILSGFLLLTASVVTARVFGRDVGLPGRLVSPRPSGYGVWRVLLIAFIGNTLFYGLFYTGMRLTSASSAAIADGAGPVISAFLAHFLLAGDRLTRRKLAALVLAFGGVVTVAFSRSSNEAGASALGCGIILLAMFFGATGTMMIVRYRGRLGLMTLVGLQHFLGGTMLGAVALYFEGADQFRNLLQWNSLWPTLYLSCVSAIAFRIWYGVVREYKVTSVAVFSFLTVLWGVGLSVVFLGERITAPLIVGLLMVIAAVMVLHGRRASAADHRR